MCAYPLGNFVHRLCRRLCRNSVPKVGRFLCPKVRHSVLYPDRVHNVSSRNGRVQNFGQRLIGSKNKMSHQEFSRFVLLPSCDSLFAYRNSFWGWELYSPSHQCNMYVGEEIALHILIVCPNVWTERECMDSCAKYFLSTHLDSVSRTLCTNLRWIRLCP